MNVEHLPWVVGHRLISSRFPPIEIYESVADPEDLEGVYALEAMTNPRILQEAGKLELVHPQDRVSGPGSSPIMAAFTHTGRPGRFSDHRHGAYYIGSSLKVAFAETQYHAARFLAATGEPDTDLIYRQYLSEVILPVQDMRSDDSLHTPDPVSYGHCQEIANKARKAGFNGFLYRSVRQPGGECMALFRPTAIKVPVIQAGHFQYHYSSISQSVVSTIRVSSV